MEAAADRPGAGGLSAIAASVAYRTNSGMLAVAVSGLVRVVAVGRAGSGRGGGAGRSGEHAGAGGAAGAASMEPISTRPAASWPASMAPAIPPYRQIPHGPPSWRGLAARPRLYA